MNAEQFVSYVSGWYDGTAGWQDDYSEEFEGLRKAFNSVPAVPLTVAPPEPEPLTPEVMRAAGFTLSDDEGEWNYVYATRGGIISLDITAAGSPVVAFLVQGDDTVQLRDLADAAQLHALMVGLGLPGCRPS